MRRKQIVHHNEVYLSTIGYLDSMKAVELRYQGIGITFDMCVVFTEYLTEKLVLCMVDGFDDVFVVAREVEEAATFAWRPKF